MKFKICFYGFVLSLYLIGCSSPKAILGHSHKEISKSVQLSAKSVVAINSTVVDQDLNKYSESYSGVIIHRDGFVLTTSHGLSNFRPKVYYKGQKFLAEVVYNNKTFDFAILKINSDSDFDYIDIANREKRMVNDSSKIFLIARAEDRVSPVFTKGYLQARDLNLSSKEVDWYSFNIKKRVKKNYAVQNGIIHSAYFQRGYSGSPLVNEEGELLGINSAGFGNKNKGMALAQEVNCFVAAVGNLEKELKLDTRHCNIQIDLEDSEVRMEWVLEGLKNHFLLMGFSEQELAGVRKEIKEKAQKRLIRNKSNRSKKKTIAWAWKEFVSQVEDK